MALDYRSKVAQAFLLDVALPAMFVGLAKTDFFKSINNWAGAFVVYTAREAVREISVKHLPSPISKLSSVAFSTAIGAYKYWNKGDNAFVGSYNNGAYEFSRHFAPEFVEDKLSPMIIEGFESSVLDMSAYSNSTIDTTKFVNGAGQGALIGAALVGLIPLIEPITKAIPEEGLDAAAAVLTGAAVYKVCSELVTHIEPSEGDKTDL